uniref:Uncharacterized protein n=1 Tax=Caulerpa cliftonii TaxID=1004391 RepID=A0A1C9JBQ6_9CHLO|nr:hypothetical protein [Caulerpa cliftonii]AOP19272.1 hypothetical protein [Caulerpa cliftonii]
MKTAMGTALSLRALEETDTTPFLNSYGRMGFENGAWDYKKNCLHPHGPENALWGILPYKKQNLEKSLLINEVCPKICDWLAECVGFDSKNNSESAMVSYFELRINIMLVFMYACALQITN